MINVAGHWIDPKEIDAISKTENDGHRGYTDDGGYSRVKVWFNTHLKSSYIIRFEVEDYSEYDKEKSRRILTEIDKIVKRCTEELEKTKEILLKAINDNK
jgi:hypothetical protein